MPYHNTRDGEGVGRGEGVNMNDMASSDLPEYRTEIVRF